MQKLTFHIILYRIQSEKIQRFMIRLLNKSLVRQFISQAKMPQVLSNLIKINNFNEFLQFHKINKQYFSNQFYSHYSEVIERLLNKPHKNIHIEQIYNLMTAVLQQNFSQLNLDQILDKLRLVRYIQMKGYNFLRLRGVKIQLIKRYESHIQAKAYKIQNIDEQIQYFHLSAYFGSFSSRKFLAEKIWQIYCSNEIALQNTQIKNIIAILNAFEIINNCSFVEQKLRGLLASQLLKRQKNIQLTNLVIIFSIYSRFDQSSLTYKQKLAIKGINTIIIQKIDELDEESIYQLLKSDAAQDLQYKKVFCKLGVQILKLISPNGTILEHKQSVIFNILSLLSSKISFKELQFDDKWNIFLFFEVQFAKDQNTSIIYQSITNFIKNNFFENKQKKYFFDLLSKTIYNKPLKYGMGLLYNLANQNFSLHTLEINFLNIKINDDLDSIQSLFMIVFILKKALQQSPNNQAFKSQIKQFTNKVALHFRSKESFIALYNKISEIGINFFHFHQTFAQLFMSLPNVFDQQLKVYNIIYLSYVVSSFQRNAAKEFFQKYGQKINLEFVVSIITKKYIQQKNPQLLKNGNILQLFCNKLLMAVKLRDRIFFVKLNAIIRKQSSLIALKILSQPQIILTWQMLNFIIHRIKLLKELKIQQQFYMTFISFLHKRYGSYHFDQYYRIFVKHLLLKIHQIQNQIVISKILENGLRFNYVQKRHLKYINLQKIKFYDKALDNRLKIIKYSKPIPIKNVTLKSLQIMFSSPLYVLHIDKLFTQILQFIQSTKDVYELESYLISYSIPFKHKNKLILTKILSCFLRQLKIIQEIDVITIFSNAVENLLCSCQQYYNLLLLTCEYYKENYNKLSDRSHLYIIKFMHSQPLQKDQKLFNLYIKKVLQQIQYKSNESLKDQIYTNVAKTSYPLSGTQFEIVEGMISRNYIRKLYYFLLIEERLQSDYRLKIAANLANKISTALIKDQSNVQLENHSNLDNQNQKAYQIYQHHYQYFKSRYPNQTKDLIINEMHLKKPKVTIGIPSQAHINIFKKIAELIGAEFGVYSFFKEDQKVIKINNLIFFYTLISKVSAYEQNKLIKRMIRQKFDQQAKIVEIPNALSQKNLAKFIKQNYPKILNDRNYQKILALINELQKQNYRRQQKIR